MLKSGPRSGFNKVTSILSQSHSFYLGEKPYTREETAMLSKMGRWVLTLLLPSALALLLAEGQLQAQCRGGLYTNRTPQPNPMLISLQRQQQYASLAAFQRQQQYALLMALQQQQQYALLAAQQQNAAVAQLRALPIPGGR
jgi:hypothetical protein